MPLADGERRVALVVQHLGHRRGVVGDLTGEVGEAAVHVRHAPHADGVVVAAGEEGRTRGGAQRRHMEVRVAQATGGEGVNVRRVDRRAVTPEL